MSTIDTLIEEFRRGKSPKELISQGYRKSTVYEAYRRYKAQEEAKRRPLIEVFKRLEEGMSLTKIVVETGLEPDEVKKYYEKWRELRELDPTQQPQDLRDRVSRLEEFKAQVEPMLRSLQVLSPKLSLLNDFLAKLEISFIKVRCPNCNVEWYHPKRFWPRGSNITVHCPNGHSFNVHIS